MGHYPTAHVFYGVYLGDSDGEVVSVVEDEDEFEHLLVTQMRPGVIKPEGHFIRDDPRWTAYFTACREAAAECPVEIIHGGDFCQGWLTFSLAIRETVVSCSSYTPKSIGATGPLNMNIVGHDVSQMHMYRGRRVAMLKQWCGYLGVPWETVLQHNPDGPRWYMVTSFG